MSSSRNVILCLSQLFINGLQNVRKFNFTYISFCLCVTHQIGSLIAYFLFHTCNMSYLEIRKDKEVFSLLLLNTDYVLESPGILKIKIPRPNPKSILLETGQCNLGIGVFLISFTGDSKVQPRLRTAVLSRFIPRGSTLPPNHIKLVYASFHPFSCSESKLSPPSMPQMKNGEGECALKKTLKHGWCSRGVLYLLGSITSLGKYILKRHSSYHLPLL